MHVDESLNILLMFLIDYSLSLILIAIRIINQLI